MAFAGDSNLIVIGSGHDNGDGTTRITVESGAEAGVGQVTAHDLTTSTTAAVTVLPGAATQASLTLAPTTIPADGTSQTTAMLVLRDQYRNLTTNGSVTLATSGDDLVSAPVLQSGGYYAATVTASTTVGSQTLTAVAGSATAQVTIQQLFPSGPATMTVSLRPSAIAPDGSSTSVVNATVFDSQRNIVTGFPVSISASGQLPVGPVTLDGNSFSATLGPTTTAGDVTVTLTAGSLTQTAVLHIRRPELTWTPAGTMSTARTGHTATLLPDGDVLVAGGYNTSVPDQMTQNGAAALASAELYHPATGSWSPAAPMATARARHTATLLHDGKVLVTGGYGATGALASTELYDPATNTWTPGASMTGARWGHTATSLPDGKVLVVGGSNTSDLNGIVNPVELYDPVANSWTTAPWVDGGQVLHTATLVPTGQVVVAGGYSNTNANTNARVYDVATGNVWNGNSPFWPLGWPLQSSAVLLDNGSVLIEGLGQAALDTPVPPFNNPWSTINAPSASRYDDTMTKLRDGRVLVTGGRSTSTQLASTEMYDPVSGIWLPEGPLGVGRDQHTSTLLPDGSVLVVGGTGPAGALASAERSVFVSPSPINMTTSLSRPLVTADGVSTSTLTVTVTDSLGHPLAGQPVGASLSGPGIIGALVDHGDGTYTTTLTASINSGTGVITVADGSVDRQMAFYQVPGLPTSIEVTANPSILHVGTGQHPSADIGAIPVDVFGNFTEGGLITATTSGDATFSSPPRELALGSYDATYVASNTIGDQTVTLTCTYGGVHLTATVVVHQVT